jgi:hypothetical protein
MALMTYDEAVAYVREKKGNVYAHVTRPGSGRRSSERIDIYLIAYNEGHEDDPDEYEFNIHYAGGIAGSSSGEEEVYSPNDAPEEARQLRYTETSAGPDALDSDVQIALLELKRGEPVTKVPRGKPKPRASS